MRDIRFQTKVQTANIIIYSLHFGLKTDKKYLSSLKRNRFIGQYDVSRFDTIYYPDNQDNTTFFDLKTKLAGKIFQKKSTYSVRLIIVDDFTHFTN